MPIPDPMGTPLSEELLACLCEALAEHDSPPVTCCLRTGDIVPWLLDATHDECCEGLSWVRIVSIFPGFPEQQVAVPVSNDILSWSVTLEMGVVRCGPFSQMVPDCDEWTAVTRAINDDAAAMRDAFCCFVNGTHREPTPRPRKGQVVPGIWTPLETLGGCAGGTMLLTVKGLPCICPPTGS
jgi:hypothetical protein